MRIIRPHYFFYLAISFAVCFFTQLNSRAQSGVEFWLAPPDITDLHNSPGGVPLYLLVSSTGAASTVTIEQPANAGFVPIVVNVAANKSVRVNLTAFKSQLETRPTNTVVNTGLHITSTTSITCYYECANTNNTDIWALKGPNAEGTEFYIPLHKHAPFNNEASFASPHQAFASFDICATQNNTVVTIYSPTPVDGHPALQQFTVNLNRGQTYSCGFTGTNWSQPSTHPSGAIVLANLPITVSLKDDSDHNPSGGCYDILGDQIVPIDVVGEDYIAVKGSLNNTGDESVVLMATQNNTQVFVDGSAAPIATLFAGEYFRIDMDSLSTSVNNALYVHCTKPTYAMHITGFGCEMGMAQLPPLNCAGSQQLNFLRDDAQTFYITVLCRTAAVNGFTITGSGTATIPPASFVTVPGTGGAWKAAKITYNTTQVPVDSTFKVSNSIDVFALGVVNGGATSGCKYGYFSEFVAPIVAFAGTDQTICANTTATLAGTVSGGSITGIWSSSGTGSFSPNNTTLNAVYTPSAADAAVGSITLTLTSTGACNPVSDAMTLTITPAPTANAGADQSKCSNNANTSLTGAVTVASGGVWTGGLGSYIPANNVLNPVYVPTASEIASGNVALTLTTTGNGICNAVSDNVLISFTPAPVVNAGPDKTVCGNNASTALSGSITVASGGVWTGGGGSFVPSATSLNPVYTATPAEISAGSVTLTLTTTGNVNCNAVSDQMTLFFSAPPVITAGPDQTKCANNAVTTLAGNVTGASGGQWSGGLGNFSPNSTNANSSYTPTAAEIANGSVTLTYTTTGNGLCNAVSDQMTIFFTSAPTADAGSNQTVCANNAVVNLTGTYSIATGASWGGGTGNFSPNNTSMNVVYTPSAAEITAGTVSLTLTTTGNGTCVAVSDPIVITITPSPSVNAGADQTRCSNNPAATLAGVITTASGGTWTGGLGTFNPSSSSLNAVYTPTAAEIASGSITLTLTTTGNGSCNASSDQVTIFYSTSPVSNAGQDQILCANNAVATLAGNVSVASGGQWSGGLGTFLPNNNTLNATYTPTASDLLNGGVTLILTTTGNNTCVAVTDQVTISYTSAPTVNSGVDQSVCGNNSIVSLTGTYATATGAVWSGGNGTFLPNTSTLNATYTPSTNEITAGSVTLTLTSTGNGTCTSVSDQVSITITPSPTVNAGADQTKCANNADATLNGSITIATGGTWSGGAGAFSPSSSSLNAVYTPTATEISNGSVTLTLTSTGNANCNAVSDQITIHYSSPPTVEAGNNQTLCSNNAVVTLSGNVTTATGAQWSGGLGIFSPGNSSLNATYTPTAAEKANGNLALTLTTTGNGGCNAVSDAVILFFTPAPTTSAGSDVTVCANNAQVTLNGSYTVATGIVWTGGTGTFSPNNTTTNAIYTPSASDIAAGSVTLTITTTGNGTCTPVSDNMIITITPLPIVNAGANINACSNNATVPLSGQIFNAGGGQWSGGQGTFFPNTTTLNATYTPTANEINSGNVTLTLTSTGNGNCVSVSDQVMIFYAPSPIANAGSNQTVCSNNAQVDLNGFINFSAGGQWSGGLGNFTPSSTALGATYQPTAGEIAAGSMQLILSTTGNGNCIAVRDTMNILFTPIPTAEAGNAITVCANNSLVSLNGNYSVASGAIWSGGNGNFTPSNTVMNASYAPSAAEISAGSLTLTLTTTGNGTCLPVTDQLDITIVPAPVVNAGSDQVTCINNLNIGMSGSVSGPTNTGIWTTTGTGTFVPNNTTLNATYQCSPADVSSGSITLFLTSTSNASCTAVSDQMTITVLPQGTATAGNDQSVCANNAVITLNGNVGGGAASGFWSSTGTGTFVPNNTSLNTTYLPSTFDKLNGSVALFLTANSCNLAVDTLHVNISEAPVVNAGADVTICSSENAGSLNGNVSGGTATGIWTTIGTGNFVPNNAALNASYTPSNNDINTQNIFLILTSSNNGLCIPVSDTVALHIYSAGTANAGSDQTLCSNNADVTLSGTLGGSATQGQWSTSGSGTFTPNHEALNAHYQPSASDIANGSVNLVFTATDVCNNANDAIQVLFTSAPTANAGADLTSCANNPEVNLNGNVTIASGGIWSGGSGTYNPNNTASNATYTPTASEIQAGTATLTYTTTGNANCNAVSDDVVINILSLPTVNAGADQNTCVDDLTVNISGSISGNSNTGIWSSSGTGTFTPSNTSLSAQYTLSAADSIAGNVILTLTTTNGNPCVAVSDQMTVQIVSAGTVNAGNDITVCANNANVNLSGTIGGGAGEGLWSTTGTGAFFPNTNTLNATYLPSSSDIANGGVMLMLTTNTCTSSVDSLMVNITPAPNANAGSDQTICASVSSVQLNGQISGGSSTGVWTTSGTGIFTPTNNAPNAVYQPSAQDIATQNITLVLTTTNNGLCLAASDTMMLHIYPLGTSNAGSDQTVCSNNPNITLVGTLGGGATTGVWNTTGSGIFIPNNNALNATYVPSAGDLLSGGVIIGLTATNSCNNAIDFLSVTFSPSPTVNAGNAQSVCGGNPSFILNGNITNAAGGLWTGGTGTFAPSGSILNATYFPSVAEQQQGFVTLTLTSTGNGNCTAVSDTLTLHMANNIISNAGVDQQVCESAPFAQLSGTVSSGSTTGNWSTLGSGTFAPDNSAFNALYTFSVADVNSGNVTLILTSTNNGNCPTARDTMHITFGQSAFAYAGNDGSICSSTSQIALHGLISGGATQGIWNTSGTGNFTPSNTDLNPVYTITPSDIAAGQITFVLNTTDHGSCLQGTDSLFYTIEVAQTITVGGDITICASNLLVPIGANVTGGSATGVWNTLGTGTFSPNNQSLNAVYQASATDSIAGSVELIFTSTNNGTCAAASDTLFINIQETPVANAGSNQSICASQNVIALNGSIEGSATGSVWTTNGSGTFSPNANALNATYTMSSNDMNASQLQFVLHTTGQSICAADNDTVAVDISPASVVNAGNDISLCTDNLQITLNGNVSGASASGIWTTNGSGSFVPNNTTLNASYIPGANDIQTGQIILVLTATNTGICSADTDTLQITIHQPATFNAGSDQTVCSSETEISLNGIIGGETTQVNWTTNGNGNFTPDNAALNAIYSIDAQDIFNGTIEFVLHATGQGACPAMQDTLILNIQSQSIANAGNDVITCSDNLDIPLSGNVTGTGGAGIWSTTGFGTFSPDNATLNATYQASPSDLINGLVNIILTTTNNGICNADQDTLSIQFQNPATVNAGVDQNLCSSNNAVSLNGTFGGGTTSAQWTSTGNGSFSPDANALNAVYTISATDISSGQVTLVLTTSGTASCGNIEDSLVVTISPEIIVNAGADMHVCSDNLSAPLAGNSTNGQGVWSTLGSGTFVPNNTTLNATYLPSANDSLVGEVVLMLSSTNSGICPATSDIVQIEIDFPSVANAGADQTLCASVAQVQLNGTITGPNNTGVWNSTGSGSFSPDNSTLNAAYIPSSTDLLNGSVSISLTTTGGGICAPSIDQMNITFIPIPSVNAGPDRTFCGETDQVVLNGIISGNNSTGIWTTNGTGTFDPNATSLATTYTMSATDFLNDEVMIILTSTNNAPCAASADTMYVHVEQMPIAAFSSVSGEQLDIQFTDESIGASLWYWDFGVGGTSTEQNPEAIYPVEGNYIVTLVITSAGGCTDTTSATVRALEPIGTPVAIPSGFSPNGDNSNDVLHVLGGPFKEVDFRIYNEWGNLVYSTTDPNGGWDGSYKGAAQPGGVYVYTATGTTVNGRFVKLSGNVTLIR